MINLLYPKIGEIMRLDPYVMQHEDQNSGELFCYSNPELNKDSEKGERRDRRDCARW